MASDVTFDFQRQERIGLSEAVLCAGKTPAQIGEIIALARERGMPLLLTRLTPDAVAALSGDAQAALDYDPRSHTGILGPWQAPEGEARVAVVTAGTSDLAIAREAIRTLAFYDVAAREIADVGVAGLWRILAHEDELRRYPAVIVVAGMEGALFSVVAGMVGGLVVAVPTSTGYGVAEGGKTALHSALASCTPGLVTVNIDNGYGAACAVIRGLGLRARASAQVPELVNDGPAEFPIVNKLGGPEEVSCVLGITMNALRMQAVRGSMPGKHMRKLMEIATSRGVEFDIADFMPRRTE